MVRGWIAVFCAVVLLLFPVIPQLPSHDSDESETLASQDSSFAMVEMGELTNVTVTHEGGVEYSIVLNLDTSVESALLGVSDAVRQVTLLQVEIVDDVTSVNFSLNGTSCSCLYWVYIQIATGEYLYEYRVEFLGTSPHTPFAVITEDGGRYVRNVLAIEGEVFTADENETFDAGFSLCTSESFLLGTCATMLDGIFNPMQDYPTVPMQWDWDDNKFSITLSVVENNDVVKDGIYIPYISIRGDNLLSSHTKLSPVTIDTTEPEVIIIGPESIDEQSGAVILDGSHSADTITDIHFSWVITEPSGAVRGPVENETGFVGNFLYIIPNQAGVWQFTLTVTDNAGNRNTTTHNMTVTNIVPAAVIYIGGVPAENGTMHRLPKNDNWTFSAEHSTDVGDDADNLIYIWSFDGEEVCTEVTCIIPYASMSGIHEMKLEVRDDDAASDSVTIEVVLFGSSSDPWSEQVESSTFSGMIDKFGVVSISLGMIILVLASTLTIWTIGGRRKVSTQEIPKWQTGKNT